MAVLGFLVFGCSKQKQRTRFEDKFLVTNPIVDDTVFSKDYVADIQSVQNVEIRAKVGGYLDQVHADEGQYVKKGGRLFTIAAQEYREELLRARALLKTAMAEAKPAEVDLQNVSKLVDEKIVSGAELEIAQSRLEAIHARIEQAKAQEASANLKLSFADIRAPFNGTIDRIPKKAGSLIEAGDLLTTIADDSQVFAYFNLSEREYLDYVLSSDKESSEIQLILANNTLYTYKGKVEAVAGRIDNRTGNVFFRARFANPDGLLKHGSSGKIRLSKPIKGALMIPQKSTFEIQDNLYVFVVDKNNIARLRKIVPSLRLPQSFIIKSGLSPQDKIVYEGIQKIKDGDIITPETIVLSHNRQH